MRSYSSAYFPPSVQDCNNPFLSLVNSFATNELLRHQENLSDHSWQNKALLLLETSHKRVEKNHSWGCAADKFWLLHCHGFSRRFGVNDSIPIIWGESLEYCAPKVILVRVLHFKVIVISIISEIVVSYHQCSICKSSNYIDWKMTLEGTMQTQFFHFLVVASSSR